MRRRRRDRSDTRARISECLKHVAFSRTAVTLCENEASSAEEVFLLRVLEGEIANRECSRRRRLFKEAAFPVFKTLSEYDHHMVKLPASLSWDALCSLDFVGEKNNLVMHGPVGTGKTHLAIALGALACERGIIVRYCTAAELVMRLTDAFRAGSLEKMLKGFLKAALLIIDEWGYVPIDKQGAQLLFRVISDSYERRSVVITTNQEFSKWGSIFTDDQMAAAMIDRLVHHGYLILFEGESYRMKHALMRQKA